MKLKVLKTVAFTALLTIGYTGCAMDSIDISEHTNQTNAGGTVTAKFTSSIIVASNGSKLLQDVERDSIHFAVGMPEGWTVTSISYYAPLHYRPIKAFIRDGEIDTLRMMLAIQESLAVFETRKTAMGLDNGMLSYLENREISTSDTAGNDTTFSSGSISKWAGYKGYIGLNIAAGSSLDTFVVDTASGLSNDTISMSFIPVYIYVTLRAGTTNGVYPIVYYEKTGSMPDPKDTSDLTLDGGDFAYFPVRVGQTSAESGILSAKGLALSLNVSPNPSNGAVSFKYNSPIATQMKIEIFAVNGAIIRTLAGNSTAYSGSVLWDGNDSKGLPVRPGIYMARVNNGTHKTSKMIQIIR
ncbi:MAG: T9SS type A sorting domain-containing protein [Fibrobacteres bacterium]|nr:T9SS type A sorting domain-containing protein [Fibrobacterota bacterium]